MNSPKKINTMGFCFEDFEVGTVYKHATTKTILESDNNLFTLLTMNHHPVHLDKEFAKKSQHKKILVVGTYVFSLVVGLTVNDISGKAIANLGYEKIEHLAPSFVGDTLRAETMIIDKRESKSKNDRGIIYVETVGYNQDDKAVIRFRRNVLVKKVEE